MYLILTLLASAAITFFIASKIAKYFLAKRPEVKWVILASLASALIVFTTYIGLNIIVAWIDLSATDPSQTLTKLHPIVMLVITITTLLLLSSVAFKVINQMCWGSAIATNVASVAIMFIISLSSVMLIDSSAGKLETAKAAPSEEITIKDESIAKLLSPN
jgi:hypothetical protein